MCSSDLEIAERVVVDEEFFAERSEWIGAVEVLGKESRRRVEFGHVRIVGLRLLHVVCLECPRRVGRRVVYRKPDRPSLPVVSSIPPAPTQSFDVCHLGRGPRVEVSRERCEQPPRTEASGGVSSTPSNGTATCSDPGQPTKGVVVGKIGEATSGSACSSDRTALRTSRRGDGP